MPLLCEKLGHVAVLTLSCPEADSKAEPEDGLAHLRSRATAAPD